MMLTQNGFIDPMAKTASEITLYQAASVLSKICRYNGHCSRFYSVAEHSLYCAGIARNRLDMLPHQVLYVLCHDVGEVFLGDIVRPIKRHIPYQLLHAENRVLYDFMKRLPFTQEQLDDVHSPEFIARVRTIDTRMAATEIEYLFGIKDAVEGHESYSGAFEMMKYEHEISAVATLFVKTAETAIREMTV